MVNLCSFLKYHKIKVDILDLENEIGRPKTNQEAQNFKEKAAQLISKFHFDVAGISCWNSLGYLGSVVTAEICKGLNAKSITVVGGYHPTALASDFIYQNSPFDFIVSGEGESALLKICTGKEKKGPKPKIIQGVPLTLRKDVDLDRQDCKYTHPEYSHIYLSRGCPFSCSFCMEPSKGCGRWRAYPVDMAIKKIKRLINTSNPKRINIDDACFGLDKRWRRGFLSGLIKNRIDKCLWAESRIDLWDKEDIDLLSQLNFEINFGIESGSEKMLGIMKKTNNPGQYLKRCTDTVRYMNKKEVPYELYFIFNHPGETYQTYKDTVKFMKSLISNQNKISGFIGAQNYAFFPGSHIHLNLRYYEKQYGTVVKHKEWWKEQTGHLKLATDVIASKDLMDKFGDGKIHWFEDLVALNQQIIKKVPAWLKPYVSKRAAPFLMKY